MGAIVMLFVGVIIALVGAIIMQTEVAAGLAMLVGGLVIAFCTFKYMSHKTKKQIAKGLEEKQKREDEELRAKRNGTWEFPVAALGESCASSGIKSVQTEAQYQKARLVALGILESRNVPEDCREQYVTRQKMQSYFAQLTAAEDLQKQQALNLELQQLAGEEAAKEAECSRYIELVGRDKTVQYCQDKIDYYHNLIVNCTQQIQQITNRASQRYSQMVQKETDWAVAGGIASGIAGGAAGVAVALDTQQKNAQKREFNAQLTRDTITLTEYETRGLRITKESAEKSICAWEENKNRAKLLLVEQMDEQMLLDRLAPTVTERKFSKTGAVHLKVQVASTKGLKIYEDVAAVVDGTFRVLLKHQGKVVGTANCCLPYAGASTQSTVECICTNLTTHGGDWEIAFAPNHLWAQEQF